MEDIAFICDKMQETNRVVDDVVAKAILVGCYNVQLVKDSLQQLGTLDRFLSVGANKFHVPWEEDTDDQREYYMMLMAASDEEDRVDV
ncbi:hypothetical protein L873DRAFT_1824268 [Choiromyces venosus 120613-1]|uniref:Uncharacterized protein n=1 Tax=Choiromyces venosus 120613-1 TaxID=1336337 RepID=A0A3N4IRN8_9PEZI|nr:hypothetical protein L873DRAFT_1824268 [Choiromyces venosus 120613-1]